jgi:hypothetical protein
MARRPQKPDEPSLLDQLSGPLRDFVKDFQTHGKNVLEQVRQRSPEKYLELSTKLAGLVAALKPEVNPLTKAKTHEEVAMLMLKQNGVAEDQMTASVIESVVAANKDHVDQLEAICAAAQGITLEEWRELN